MKLYIYHLLQLGVLAGGFVGACAVLNLPEWSALLAVGAAIVVHWLLIGGRGRRS